MLDQSTRVAILRLHEEGHGARAIARALRASFGPPWAHVPRYVDLVQAPAPRHAARLPYSGRT
jgi:hypothetical protein